MRVFHHVLLKFGHENAEMQKRKFDDVTLQYSINHNFEKHKNQQTAIVPLVLIASVDTQAAKRVPLFGCLEVTIT